MKASSTSADQPFDFTALLTPEEAADRLGVEQTLIVAALLKNTLTVDRGALYHHYTAEPHASPEPLSRLYDDMLHLDRLTVLAKSAQTRLRALVVTLLEESDSCHDSGAAASASGNRHDKAIRHKRKA